MWTHLLQKYCSYRHIQQTTDTTYGIETFPIWYLEEYKNKRTLYTHLLEGDYTTEEVDHIEDISDMFLI